MPLSLEQIEQRRSLITASDAAAICGINPFATAHDVYAAKVGDVPWEGNYRTRRGDYLEPLGIELLGEHVAPLTVKSAGSVTRVHRILSWLGATPDGVVLCDADGREVAVGEVKTAGVRAASAWDDEIGEPTIPDHYRCQVQVQLTVCSLKQAYLCAMLDSEDEPRFYEIEHCADDEAIILEECDRFRRQHLEPRIPPPIDNSEASARMVKALFRRPSRDLLQSDAMTELLAAEYIAAREAAKEADERKRGIQSALCARIGEHEGITGQGWSATWKYREPAMVAAYERKGGRHFDLRERKAR